MSEQPTDKPADTSTENEWFFDEVGPFLSDGPGNAHDRRKRKRAYYRSLEQDVANDLLSDIG